VGPAAGDDAACAAGLDLHMLDRHVLVQPPPGQNESQRQRPHHAPVVDLMVVRAPDGADHARAQIGFAPPRRPAVQPFDPDPETALEVESEAQLGRLATGEEVRVQARDLGVRAVFGSRVFPSAVLEVIATEAGATYVPGLSDDALPGQPGDPSHNYLELMRRNAIIIIEGLGGDPAALQDPIPPLD
jgi:hypothetical protein